MPNHPRAADALRYADPRIVELPPRIAATEPRIVVRATADEDAARVGFREGLVAKPATTSPKFLYDAQGSALFSAICELDEYYPTRTEAAIFERDRDEIAAALPRGSQWIDLGCGDALKSRGWLAPADVRRYVGIDIAEEWLGVALRSLSSWLAAQAPRGARGGAVEVLGIVADFTRSFDFADLLAERPALPPVFFYPGSSIGNFTSDAARTFLAVVRRHITEHPTGDGRLLIGVDLVKDRATLEAAYDDRLGVTAAFNRNVLRVANRLLDADFDPGAFAHRAVFDDVASRVEMHLVARRAQEVRIGATAVRFAEGEAITTEYSHKYTVDGFTALLRDAGFATDGRLRCWRDTRDWFGVFVAEPA